MRRAEFLERGRPARSGPDFTGCNQPSSASGRPKIPRHEWLHFGSRLPQHVRSGGAQIFSSLEKAVETTTDTTDTKRARVTVSPGFARLVRFFGAGKPRSALVFVGLVYFVVHPSRGFQVETLQNPR